MNLDGFSTNEKRSAENVRRNAGMNTFLKEIQLLPRERGKNHSSSLEATVEWPYQDRTLGRIVTRGTFQRHPSPAHRHHPPVGVDSADKSGSGCFSRAFRTRRPPPWPPPPTAPRTRPAFPVGGSVHGLAWTLHATSFFFHAIHDSLTCTREFTYES